MATRLRGSKRSRELREALTVARMAEARAELREAREDLNELRESEDGERGGARARARWAEIRALTSGALKCARCERGPITNSRSWAIISPEGVRELGVQSERWAPHRGDVAVCRACKFALISARARQRRTLLRTLTPIAACPASWTVRPASITAARERAGMTQAEVARECGWSKWRQGRIEMGLMTELGHEDLVRFLALMQERGVDTGETHEQLANKQA